MIHPIMHQSKEPPKSHPPSTTGGTLWPADFHSYQLLEKVGQGAFASVWRSRCTTNGDKLCAIKIIDLEHVDSNFVDIRLEAQTMRLSSHPNVLPCYTSFIQCTNLWLVTQLMNKGSSLNCIQSARIRYRNQKVESHFTEERETPSFEKHITYILHETIHGLKYIHDNGKIHRDIKAGNILLDSDGNVRIADFGVSGWLVHGGNTRENTRTFVGTPCWMAPEVMEQVHGYDYKADIWSIGITALELAKGYAPYSKYAPMKVLLLTIQEDPPSLDTYTSTGDENEEQWSDSFRSMIQLCLQKDPRKRPNCEELLNHFHFKGFADPTIRYTYKAKIQKEICNIISYAGFGNVKDCSNDRRNKEEIPLLSGHSSNEQARPAGTTWNFDESERPTSTQRADSNDSQAFFDQFERSTKGENFVHPSYAAKQQEENQQEKDELNDFMDNFEKATSGENFLRRD